MGDKKACKCMHHKAVPLGITVIGSLFLLGSLNILTGAVVSFTWPIILIIMGLTKLMGSKCKCC
jgi:predicted membrane protein